MISFTRFHMPGYTQVRWVTLGLVIGTGLGAGFWTAHAEESSSPLVEPPSGVLKLGLADYLRLVLQHNESLQIRLLEVEIARHRYQGERGVFEPELVGSYEYLETERENTAEQRRNLGVAVFEERNNIYTGGLEGLVPSGGRVRLGYTMRELHNNLFGNSLFNNPSGTIFTNQWSAFMGLTLTQPLLKNGGRAATLANIRVAALASDVAYQDYRRQLMLLVSAAEVAYWNLYMAQEQLLFFRDSVALAESILRDNRARLDAGRSFELEVLESESGLALRRSRQSEALQKFFEAANRVAMLFSHSVINTNKMVIAAEQPAEQDRSLDYFEAWQQAFESNPDYLAQQKKLLQENIKLAFAKNQRWPQFDLKASYGLNGLGETHSEAWTDIEEGGFPSWSIGMELRIPLTGGRKSKHELAASRLRQEQALLGLKELETQLANGLDTALRKVRSSRDSVRGYRKTVEFNQNLLQTQLARLELGRVDSRKVLEVEEDLFEAKNFVVDALVNYRRAILELELLQGAILQNRNIEVSKEDLESRTSMLVQNGRLTPDQYRYFVDAMQYEYYKNAGFKSFRPRPYDYSKPQPAFGVPEPLKPMSEEQATQAREVLRSTQPNVPPEPPPLIFP